MKGGGYRERRRGREKLLPLPSPEAPQRKCAKRVEDKQHREDCHRTARPPHLTPPPIRRVHRWSQDDGWRRRRICGGGADDEGGADDWGAMGDGIGGGQGISFFWEECEHHRTGAIAAEA
jgi:hypothetical protein